VTTETIATGVHTKFSLLTDLLLIIHAFILF
jgi:hypothetical protein